MKEVQLALPFEKSEQATFSNFNADNIPWLGEFLERLDKSPFPFFFIYGERNSGKTHLLQALLNRFSKQGKQATYLPLSKLNQSPYLVPQILENAASLDLICLDDIEYLIGKTDWELALFSLLKEIEHSHSKTVMVFSASVKMSHIRFAMPDLQSRFHLSNIYRLPVMSNEQKQHLLIDFAKQRGAVLSAESAEFLLTIYDDNFAIIFNSLTALIAHAKQSHRRLTKSFILEKLEH